MNYYYFKNRIKVVLMTLSLFICVASNAQLQLIHYWDFNSTSPSGGGGGTNLSPLHADYSKISTTTAYLSLGVTPTSYTLDNGPSGSILNEYHMLGNDTFGLAADNYYVRARNPLQNIPFFWHLPTTNYENITLTFASELSSAGKAVLSYSYSLDGGTTYSTTGLPITTYTPGTTWSTSTINLSTIPGANNNPNFIFIISNTLNATGNYRFDNVALLGDTVTVSASATNSNCFGGVGSATATPSGTGPYTYTWAPSGGNASIANNLTPGTYTVSITDTYSITATTTVAITQPNVLSSVITSTNVNCFGNNTGSASILVSGGTSSYTYTWSPSGGNAATASNLTAGNYTVNVTDANSCTTNTTLTITQPTAALSASISTSTNVNCFGNNSGSATASVSGGTSSYTYTWSPSGGNTATASNLAANTYTVNITDANSCTTNTTVTITQPTVALNANISASSNVSCNGGSNGSATVSVSGGAPSYTYTWSPSGGNSATASNLTTGNFTINVTDNNGCSASNTVTITQPTVALTASITASNNVTCFGLSNATATVSGSGGTGSYAYLWSNNQTSATATNLSATHAQKLIHYWDMNNTLPSTGVGGISVSPLAAGYSTLGHAYLVWNNLPTTPTSCGCTKRDSLLDNGTGGSILNEYNILGNDSSGTTAGNLYIRMRNPSNNLKFLWYMPTTNYKNLQLSYVAELSSAGKANNTYWYSLDSGLTFSQANLPVTSYTPGLTWATQTLDLSAITGANNNAKFVFAITNTSAGATGTGGNCRFDNIALQGDTLIAGPTYTAIITDANGCTSNPVSVTITQPALLTASISASANVNCFGQNSGNATASVIGGNSSYTYTWSPSGGNSATASNLVAGTYTVNVSDAKGCNTNTIVTITQPSAISTAQSFTLCSGSNIIVGSNTYSTSGTYTDVLTSANSCDSTVTTNLTVNNAINVSVNVIGETITANNATASSYQWVDCNNGNSPISGQTNLNFTATSPGNYAVIITEGSCSATSTCTAISTTGITQNNVSQNNVTIYPNPSNGAFVVTTAEAAKTIIVMDVLGNELLNLTPTDKTTTINLNLQANGIYFVKVISDNMQTIKRIIINN